VVCGKSRNCKEIPIASRSEAYVVYTSVAAINTAQLSCLGEELQ